MALSIQDKAAFLDMACQLSPENLFADGERSRTAAMKLRSKINAEWKSLEKKAGVKVSELEAYEFSDEVDAWHQAQRDAEIAKGPQNPLVTTGPNAGTWYRKGVDGRTAYYIWGPKRGGNYSTGKYEVFSEFSYMFGGREKIGEVVLGTTNETEGLNRAVQIGEDFLAGINYETLLAVRPQYLPENLKRELQRMPKGFDLKIPAMPKVSGFNVRIGDELILENVSIECAGEVIGLRLKERGQHATITSV
jgi:hypothetical protein